MFHKTIFHTLSDGTKAKFSICDRIIDGESFFYGYAIGTEMESYKSLSDMEKETYYGIEITNSRQQSINYRDCKRLINDILTKYGHE